MAARVASIAGIVAASAALSQAAPARPAVMSADAASGDTALSDEGRGVADQLGDAVRVRNAGGCGCSPCWGPPAPPAMRTDLFEEGLS
jgi:hypothetical protein